MRFVLVHVTTKYEPYSGKRTNLCIIIIIIRDPYHICQSIISYEYI